MNKEEFTKQVEIRLAEEDAKTASDPTNLFGYESIKYPKHFFNVYFDMGYSVEDVIDELNTSSY
jgi:hypothetical protein